MAPSLFGSYRTTSVDALELELELELALAPLVEQAELNLARMGGEQREIEAQAVLCRARGRSSV